MKNTLITCLFSFFVLATCYKSMSAPIDAIDTSLCLEIEGYILNVEDGTEQTCTVELLNANRVVKTLILKKGKKKFKFILNKNTAYAIRISKKDHITKLISIDTRMHKDPYGMKYFLFETKMIAQGSVPKCYRDYLDYPIANIYYDGSKDDFVHDKEFTNKMKKELAMK